ncbi:MAG: hypothetical protein OEV49_14270 [candidate division Zixibacteria bacterium]|nr:hypothetical protein [candidate division Zixibacteria bacterium]MDH3937795.1 hypothetical protein [candidate division Zixibacteria bacterium]MDH4035513.1 hypothetical protein [candidate division Zixibacteria bacterium]
MPFDSEHSRRTDLPLSFLCAGSSALLIAVSHLYPEFWFVSLIALIPFLWRAVSVGLLESILLGVLLAASYCFVSFRLDSWATLGAFLFALGGLVVLFALYGTVVNRIGKYIGINVIFISAVWLPIEYALSHYTGLGSLLAMSAPESGLLFRIGSLFGMLMISFAIVIVNSIILIIIRHIADASLSRGILPSSDAERSLVSFKEIILERRYCIFPAPRAPPLSRNVT